MKFQEIEYSRKIAPHDNVELFWNMEYSWNIPEKYYNKQNLTFFGIWNIPKKSYYNQKCHYNNPFLAFNKFIFDISWNM